MGDMADYILQWDMVEDLDVFCDPPGLVWCKFCGAGPFLWVETDHGWRLAWKTLVHSCKDYGK